MCPPDDVSVANISRGTLTPAICAGIDRIRTIRAAIGADIDLMVDCHSRFNPGILIQVAKELEDLHLFWIEDAVSLDNLDAFAYMSQSIGIPIATGERLRTLTDFDRLLTEAHVDYILPDVKHVGGISGLKKIADACCCAKCYDNTSQSERSHRDCRECAMHGERPEFRNP